jgi:hypothetical protein
LRDSQSNKMFKSSKFTLFVTFLIISVIINQQVEPSERFKLSRYGTSWNRIGKRFYTPSNLDTIDTNNNHVDDNDIEEAELLLASLLLSKLRDRN